MTSTELARRLPDAALACRASRNERTVAELESLARDAAAHVSRVGEGTVLLTDWLLPVVELKLEPGAAFTFNAVGRLALEPV